MELSQRVDFREYTPYIYQNKNSVEGGVAPAGAKVTGATIRKWLLNKYISFLAVLSWKTGLKENVDKVPSGAHIFPPSAIPSNGYISSTVSCTDFLYYYSSMIMECHRKMCKSHWSLKYRSRSMGQDTCQVSTSTMQGLVVVELIVEEVWNIDVNCVKVTRPLNIGQGHQVKIPAKSGHQGDTTSFDGCLVL